MFEQRKRRSGIITALFGLLIVSTAPGAFETLPIAREPGHQQFPAIDDCTVAWQTDRNGDWDIAFADISYPGSIDPLTLADMLSESQYPAVSGNVIVWENQFFMYDDCDIVGLDLSTETFFDVVATYADECSPAVSGNLVVAQSRPTAYAGWNIYGYNLTTKTAFPIVSQDADQTHPAITFSPWLKAYVVVWQDYRNGNWDIYGAILSGPEVAGCASPWTGDVDSDSITDARDINEVEARLGQQNGIPLEPD